MKAFVERMNTEENKNTPYFSFNTMRYHTHDHLYLPPDFDNDLVDFIKDLEAKSYLDNTLFMILSDHGSRTTKYSIYTDIGILERSTPFFGIRLPKTMWNTQYEENVKYNQDKLISVFDLYKTLKHFHYLNNFDPISMSSFDCRKYFQQNTNAVRSKRGMSLFEKIPSDRSCKDALIPNVYCLCNQLMDISHSAFFKETNITVNETAVKFVIEHIHSITGKFRSKCVPYMLEKVVSVKKFEFDNLYQFLVLLQPGNSLFQSVLKVDQGNKTSSSSRIVVTNSVRLSSYSNQSWCLESKFVGFCFCKKK